MWKHIKTLVFGFVLLTVGIVVLPIGTTILIRGLEVQEVRFTMPNEIGLVAENEVGYNIFKEFLNVFRTDVEETEQSKFLGNGIDVMVEDFDEEEFLFWIQFGYIAAGSLLSLLFSASGLVCIFLGYLRLTHRDPAGIQSDRVIIRKKVTRSAGTKLKHAKPAGPKKKERSFLGMRS